MIETQKLDRIDATNTDVAEYTLSPFARILQPGVALNPFALLVNPEPAQAAASRAEALDLPRHALYLFGKKGITSSPEISRLDQDMDLGAELEED